MKRIAIGLLASLALFALSPGWALADGGIVDQSNTALDGYVPGGIVAQTFTSGAPGFLQSVELRLRANHATVTVMIEDTTGSPRVPLDGTLATMHKAVTTTSDSGDWVLFPFDVTPLLEQGHVYAIVVGASASVQIAATDSNKYPGGQALTLQSLVWVPTISTNIVGLDDWAFRTYMQVVEPQGPAPTDTPAPAPTTAPTTAPTPVPTDTPAPTDTAAPTDTPSLKGVATAAPTADPGAVSTPSSGSGSSSGSSGNSDMALPLLAALILVLGVALGGGGFAFWRLRHK